MIMGLVCRCSGADTKLLSFIRDHSTVDWTEVPVKVGKVKSLEAISSIPLDVDGPDNPIPLANLVDNHSRYMVIMGYKNDRFMWADISHGDPKSLADAEIILEQFA